MAIHGCVAPPPPFPLRFSLPALPLPPPSPKDGTRARWCGCPPACWWNYSEALPHRRRVASASSADQPRDSAGRASECPGPSTSKTCGGPFALPVSSRTRPAPSLIAEPSRPRILREARCPMRAWGESPDSTSDAKALLVEAPRPETPAP